MQVTVTIDLSEYAVDRLTELGAGSISAGITISMCRHMRMLTGRPRTNPDDEAVAYQTLQLDPNISRADLAKQCGWVSQKGTPLKYRSQRVVERLIQKGMVNRERGTGKLSIPKSLKGP